MDKKSSYKLKRLKEIIRNLDSCVLAYSGGVDSTLLLKVAKDELQDRILAVTAHSETYPRGELEFAKNFAKGLGARHLIIKTDELKDDNFIQNSQQRCYYCKRALFSRLRSIAKKYKIKNIIDASNADDQFDFRPGRQAAKAMKVRSPLEEAGLNKKDIYALSRYFNLPTRNKPSLACLASRFPYGEKLSSKKLFIVDNIESFIKSLGIKQVRLRHHGKLARIEVNKDDFNRVMKNKSLIVNRIKALGYNYISLDLEGYRTGSLNEALKHGL